MENIKVTSITAGENATAKIWFSLTGPKARGLEGERTMAAGIYQAAAKLELASIGAPSGGRARSGTWVIVPLIYAGCLKIEATDDAERDIAMEVARRAFKDDDMVTYPGEPSAPGERIPPPPRR